MAVRLDRIYTKKGDNGTTHLIGGVEISKGSLQVECYGTLDELNCHLGIVRTLVREYIPGNTCIIEETESVFGLMQNHLFDLGVILAQPTITHDRRNRSTANQGKSADSRCFMKRTEYLEKRMDCYLRDLDPLNSFVLPGSGRLNGQLHLSRAVARRCERLLVRWSGTDHKVDRVVLAYVNRLSDFLFVYSRWISKKLGENERLWEPEVQ